MQGAGVPLVGTLRLTVLDVAPGARAGAVVASADVGFTTAGAPTDVVVPVHVATAYRLAEGHRLGVGLNLLSPWPVGATLLYDSDRYPTGVSLATGSLPPGCLPAVAPEAYPPLLPAPPTPPSR